MYQTNFTPRNKGQRYEKQLLPSLTFEENGKLFEALVEDVLLGTINITGEKDGIDSFGAAVTWQYIEVTLNDGTIVPAYRRKSPENNYAICQNFRFKAVRTQTS